jgi:hypothetical protein
MNNPLVAETVAPDYPHLARQQHEHAGTQAARAIEQGARRVAGPLAEAPYPFDFRFREDGEHLLVPRMIAHARVFEEIAVEEVRVRGWLTGGRCV